MKNLIIPVAGQSSRYKTQRPKWLLTMPNGKLMIEESLAALETSNFDRIIVVALRDHVQQFTSESVLLDTLGNSFDSSLELIQLDSPTKSQAETISVALNMASVHGNFFVKDCDNSFKYEYQGGNVVCTMDLHAVGTINAANKSYVQTDPLGVIRNIIEKRVISNQFCCGGYGFDSVQEFQFSYDILKNHKDLYLSHIIFQMIASGQAFKAEETTDYFDWGTQEDFEKYCDGFRSIFCDLDGVIFKNSSKFSPNGWTYEPILENIQAIKGLANTRLIITTARPAKFKNEIRHFLEKNGLHPTEIITDLPHARRFLINDYAPSNPYPSAVAINIPRNSPELNDLLK